MLLTSKTLSICIAVCILISTAQAIVTRPIEAVPREREVETLVHEPMHIGINGGPVIKFCYIDDQFAVLLGGRGGISFGDLFVIGGAGYGLVNEIRVPNSQIPYEYLSFGYGGVMLEFLIPSRKVLHLSIHSLIGGGNLFYHDYYWGSWGDDLFFVVEPGLDLELNVTRYFRIGLGGTYRFVDGIDFPEFTDQDFSGFNAALTFKFGRF